MKTIHIDQATNAQIDYAVAIAQGWDKSEFDLMTNKSYSPTIDELTCGELIDSFKINILFKNNLCECFIDHAKAGRDKSRLVAACKAFLWSKYPDGQIPLQN